MVCGPWSKESLLEGIVVSEMCVCYLKEEAVSTLSPQNL